jgi:hypothetical protein
VFPEAFFVLEDSIMVRRLIDVALVAVFLSLALVPFVGAAAECQVMCLAIPVAIEYSSDCADPSCYKFTPRDCLKCAQTDSQCYADLTTRTCKPTGNENDLHSEIWTDCDENCACLATGPSFTDGNTVRGSKVVDAYGGLHTCQ